MTPFPAPADRPFPAFARLNLVLVAGLAVTLTAVLWPQWRHNPDLSHGIFMPVICLLLLHEARSNGTKRFFSAGPALTGAIAVSLLLGLGALALAGLYAAAIDWSNPITSFALAGSLTWLMVATALGFAGRDVRLLPFNWSTVLAAGLWVLNAPIPPGTYGRLTFSLQLFVSQNVLHALHLLGIAANLHGNIIELARTSVGVEEACSGVRSLISCVFAGLLFSGLLVRRPWSRALLIGLAGPLALLMNFFRSLALTLLANAGVNINGRWHDLTGFAVLGVTATLLAALALALERREKKSRAPASPTPSAVPASAPQSSPRVGLILPAAGLTLATSLALFFAFHTSFAPALPVPVPDLEAILPRAAVGWEVNTKGDLGRFKEILQTDHFVQRSYVRNAQDGMHQITIYIAYWSPGQASASLVATHTPDACWPGAGWVPVPAATTRESARTGEHPLPPAEHRFFQQADGFPQHVWFWQLYDRQPIPYLDPLAPRNLLRIALRYGFRRPADQMFVRVSSNRSWSEIAGEPIVEEIFAGLRPLGL